MPFVLYLLHLLKDVIDTKSRGGCCRLRLIGADGDASQKTSFPLCRHQYLQRYASHDDNSRHGSKSGRRPSKKSAFGGKKSLIPKFIMAKYGLIPKSFLWIYALIPKSFVAKFGLIQKSLGCLPTAGNAFG